MEEFAAAREAEGAASRGNDSPLPARPNPAICRSYGGGGIEPAQDACRHSKKSPATHWRAAPRAPCASAPPSARDPFARRL
jgi:hypothetical protein